MRIDELLLPQTIYDAGNILIKHGYNNIGIGTFASIFKKSGSNYVLKLFNSRDIPYINFIKIAKKLQSNKYFPKIIGNIVKINANYSAIRLEPLRDGDFNKLKDFADLTFDYIDSIISKDTAHPDTMKIINSDDKLKQACELIAKICIITGCSPDLHEYNIMMRGNDFVFVDPLYDKDLHAEEMKKFGNKL